MNRTVIAMCLCLLLITASVSFADYALVNIGPSIGSGSSFARSINKHGEIVGYYYVGASTHPFLLDSSGNIQDLATLPGNELLNHAWGINDAGYVVGDATDPAGPNRAYVYSFGGGTIDLGKGYALSINEAGQVAGDSSGAACVWDAAGNKQSIGSYLSLASDINESGLVVGSFQSGITNRAFIWDAVNLRREIAPLQGTSNSDAYGVNDLGQVVGRSYNISLPTSSDARAFLWDIDNGARELMMPAGAVAAEAYRINNKGQIVGTAMDGTGRTRAVLWNGLSEVHYLDTLSDGNASAHDINEDGWIVGWCETALGGNHMSAVLWQPVPEPSGLVVMLLGVTGPACMAFKRRK